MEKLGLVINIKRMLRYWIFMIIGMALIFNGITGYYYHKSVINSKISDAEIIERAKALGMVELKEKLQTEIELED